MNSTTLRLPFLPIIENPEKILCVGLNYQEHVSESQADLPSEPVIFSKFNNALTRHQAVIPQPLKGKELDYEAELVLVIDQPGFAIAEEDALNYVFGYSIGNDLSIRALQFMGAQQ
ncbi:hypothetical protein CL176_10105 [Suicoccus acidiformans]|uniref:Fumarylacetoacetase-like C-terminal domain-containing protein n=1 Tax=Suicoccus acidiformans TaxID=2036206 RepID=A0A347WML3_9LACT|nr:hypothetical protein CL176_10105 [Suicoccus acidiformans]